MKGSDFCDILATKLEAKNDSDLARMLGYTPAHISNTRKIADVSPKRVDQLLDRLVRFRAGSIVLNAVHPIVEFFEIAKVESKGGYNYHLFDHDDCQDLRDALANSRGIYTFYNSEGEIVYVGKAEKQSLLKEMTSAFNRSRPSHRMMYVNHPIKGARPNTKGNVRRIVSRPAGLWHACSYFSAYEVQGDLINILEAFLIRAIPNDVVNVKMESGRTQAALNKFQNS